ncbi:ribonuclease H [Trifolium pratense]|uniref:Ribonuclease H n=1 Tax=Trifolium pratense TaxID=57577 RepID=A0A2K3P639_TRIPR|nr:ribonuclease H [Trifolium pratense]
MVSKCPASSHISHGHIRQGDPLSHYLCMEKLSIAINDAVQHGAWNLIHFSDNDPRLSHLFADDVMLFTKAKNSQLHFINSLFDCFSCASGLKINSKI